MKSDFAILILSCDKYSDLWEPFFKLFWKYWPNCPYKLYLGSNEIKFIKDRRVINILSGKDVDWSTSYKKILSQISERYLFIWLEDVFITSKVDSDILKLSFDLLRQNGTKHIHFKPVPKPDSFKNNYFGEYLMSIPYRVNVIGFWNKRYLEKLLIKGEDVWHFEIMASYRVSYENGFYCLTKPAIRFIHLIEKGYWLKKAVYYCEKNNITLDLNKRSILKMNLFNSVKDKYFNVIINIPWTIRLKIMNLFRKLLASY